MPLEKTLEESIKKSCDNGCYCAQFFLGNPYSINRRSFTKQDIDNANVFIKRSNIDIFSHLPYVYNLAGNATKNKIAWNNDKETDDYLNLCIDSITKEIDQLDKLVCKNKGCVLHIGSCKDVDKGLEAVATSINKINFSGNTPLILETMVGNGSKLGCTFDQLAKVYSLVDNKENVKFCIDTCHIFAQGLYDFKTTNSVDKMLEDFDRTLGLKNLACVHLNDSIFDFGEKKDRHQLISKGYCFKDKNILEYTVSKFQSLDVPMILETEPQDVRNVIDLLTN